MDLRFTDSECFSSFGAYSLRYKLVLWDVGVASKVGWWDFLGLGIKEENNGGSFQSTVSLNLLEISYWLDIWLNYRIYKYVNTTPY